MGTPQKSGISDEANWGDVALVLLLDPCHNLSNKGCMGRERRKDERLAQL